MSQSVSPQTRKVVVALVILAALFMLVVEPFIVDYMLDKIHPNQVARYETMKAEGDPKAPLLAPAPWLVSVFFPFWMSIAMFAGIVLLLIAKALYNGAVWAKQVSLVCLALGAFGGAYMLLPWLNFVAIGFSPAMIIMFVPLVPYFAIVVVDAKGKTQKWIDFYVFLILGVTAAETFGNGHAATRVLMGHPKMPLYAEGIFILQPSRNIGWLVTVVLLIAIYLLAKRKESGWYAAMAGGWGAAIMGFATHYVRGATVDYLVQGLMGLAIVIPLMIPFIKERLIEEKLEASEDTSISM